jgi:hypothetical protein
MWAFGLMPSNAIWRDISGTYGKYAFAGLP